MQAIRNRCKHLLSSLTLVAILALLLPVTVYGLPEDLFQTPEQREAAGEQIRYMIDIMERNDGTIMNQPGVLGWGIFFHAESGALAFQVDYDQLVPPPGTVPSIIEGVPVYLNPTVMAQATNGGSGCTPSTPCHADELPFPVQMGNSGFAETVCAACTIGFKACDDYYGGGVYVTNAHCSPDASMRPGSAPIGTIGRHPSRLDVAGCGYRKNIGTVGGHAFNCFASNLADATKYTSSDGLTSKTIRDIGTPSGSPASPLPGDLVVKSGRSTGFRQGYVVAINFSCYVDYGAGCPGGPIWMKQQIKVRSANPNLPFTAPGDSGSALVRPTNPPQIAGLNFAGATDGSYSIANKVQNVLSALHVTLPGPNGCPPYVGPCPPGTDTGDPCSTPFDLCICGQCYKNGPPKYRMCLEDHTWSDCTCDILW